MVSIRVSDEGFRQNGRLVDLLVVCGALQIVKHMLGSLPMSWTRVGVESGKNSSCIGNNVWPCGDCQIHQGANN
jgi:hypothetical protein